MGFVAPGLTKVLGHRFADPTIVTSDTPIGAFFDAFFQSGPYYVFVGTTQVIAACLLLFRRTAPLGAVVYFPIIANIFMITAAMDFVGTAQVTGLMLLACLFLLCWYYPFWKGLLFVSSIAPGAAGPARGSRVLQVAWWLGALGGIGLACTSRGLFRDPLVVYTSLTCLVGACLLTLWFATAKVFGFRFRSA